MIRIKKPDTEDVEQIQDVFFKTWLATYPNEEVGITVADIEERHKNRFDKEVLEKRRKAISMENENRLFLIAKDADRVVGVCSLSKNEDLNELQAIYVLPEYQKRGIGLMFWEEAKRFFDNEVDIIVKVVEYNKGAINFYKKLGFVDTGKRVSEERFRMPISGKCFVEAEMIIKRNSQKNN